MDKKRIIEDIIRIKRTYRDVWTEKEYEKIEEMIEKQRAAREKLLNYVALN